MKNKIQIPFYNIYVIAAFICILFVRFVEGGLDYSLYRGGALYLFLWTYEFLAVPGFFFFTTLYLGCLVFLNIQIRLPDLASKILTSCLFVLIPIYLIFSILNLLRLISIHFVGFVSPYSLFLAVLGFLSSIIICIDHNLVLMKEQKRFMKS